MGACAVPDERMRFTLLKENCMLYYIMLYCVIFVDLDFIQKLSFQQSLLMHLLINSFDCQGLSLIRTVEPVSVALHFI